MSRLREKLVLGTASFGGQYGVANSSKMSDSEVAELTKEAIAAGVLGFDTAINYGNSQLVLASSGVPASMVYSKIEEVPEDSAELIEVVRKIVRDYDGGCLRGLTIHRPDSLIQNPSAKRRALDDLRATGLVESLGVSVYDPETVRQLSALYEFDYVQAPVNLFDQRFIQSSVSDFFEREGLWLQGRSVFLQGALLSPKLWHSSPFRPYSHQFRQAHEFAESLGLSIFGLTLEFVMSLPQLKELVIGVNQISHLKSLLEYELSETFDHTLCHSLTSQQLDLIDPRRWQL